MNGKGEAAKYQYNGLGHRVGKKIGKACLGNMEEGLDPVKRLQSRVVIPEEQIQYTIDLTREYHNLLQVEENKQLQRFLWDGNVAGMVADVEAGSTYYLQDDLGSPIRLADRVGKTTLATFLIHWLEQE